MTRWIAPLWVGLVLATASVGAAQGRGDGPPFGRPPAGANRQLLLPPASRSSIASPLGRPAIGAAAGGLRDRAPSAAYRAVPRGANAAVITQRRGADVYTVRGAGRTRFAFAPPSGRPTPLTVRTAAGEVGVRVVAFDLDGTLVDTRPSLADGIRAGLAALDLPADEAFVSEHNGGSANRSAGDTVVDRFREVLAAREPGGRLTPEREAQLRQTYRTASHDTTSRSELAGVHAYPGAAAMLADLRRQGVRVVAVTSRTTEAAHTLLRHAGIAHHFDVVVGRQDLAYRGPPTVVVRGEVRPGGAMPAKPSPATLFYALQLAGRDSHPSETVFVGDRVSDVEAADGAGVPAIAISHGTQSEAALRDARPAVVVSNIAQLRDALGLTRTGSPRQ